MKKITLLVIVSILLIAVVAFANISDVSAKKNACTTIQSGDLVASDGSLRIPVKQSTDSVLCRPL